MLALRDDEGCLWKDTFSATDTGHGPLGKRKNRSPKLMLLVFSSIAFIFTEVPGKATYMGACTDLKFTDITRQVWL